MVRVVSFVVVDNTEPVQSDLQVAVMRPLIVLSSQGREDQTELGLADVFEPRGKLVVVLHDHPVALVLVRLLNSS